MKGLLAKSTTERLGLSMRTSWTILLTIVGSLFHVALADGQEQRRDRSSLRPNIVFIMADDLGYGDLGCYGQKLIQTPNIDRMAQEGTRFTHCYAGAPVCAPSRSALMTGQHTGHTRVRDNSGRVGGVPDEISGEGHRIPLLDNDITIAEVLKQAGYATGMTGKWGLGEAGTTGEPNRQGFDEWYGYLNQNHAVFYFTDYLWRNAKRETIFANANNARQAYTHDLFTEFALDFIRRHHHEPFFLYVPYTIPHADLEVPSLEPYTGRDWPEEAKIFAAMVTRMDRSVGKILELLEQLNIDDNTLVFFTSDNGSPIGGGPLFNSNGVFQGKKGTLQEGGLRTPMIVRWPNKVPRDRVSETPWYFPDILPTLAELSGAQLPQSIDGISILPSLLGQPQDLSQRIMYWERPPGRFQQAARQGKWKALRPGRNQPLRLYDVVADPTESSNVAAEHPDLITKFEAYFSTARTESPNWPDSLNDRQK
jgi:arylsulfatase A-like enzyme